MRGEDIKQARLRRGWTQKTLAEKLWITQAHVARLESGTRKIPYRLEMQLKALFEELRDDE